MRQQETCEFEIYSHMTGNREKLFENIHFPHRHTRQRAHKYPNTYSVRGISLFLFCAVANLKNLVRCGGTRDVLLVCSRTRRPLWHEAAHALRRQRLFDPPTRCSSRSNESKNKMHSLARTRRVALLLFVSRTYTCRNEQESTPLFASH